MRFNPDIPLYSHQQHTISNVNAFKDIFNIQAAYWMGFLCADGHVSRRGDHAISFSQATLDEESVEAFADFIGFDRSRIYYNKPSFRKNSKGEIKKYLSTVVSFRSRIMNKRLQELGFFSSKDERKSVPDFVKQAIVLAKVEAGRIGIHWSQTEYGKIAHAWLLGFFDGDGSHHGGYTAILTAGSKELLLEIKFLFESPNIVRTVVEPGTKVMVFDKLTIATGSYRLTLGPDVFKRILVSYQYSMERKRPNVNFGDEFFIFNGYYEPNLIDELKRQGIEVDRPELMAIIRNREGKIIWLDQGTTTRGFTHIILRHKGDFRDSFGIDIDRSIGEFILKAIKSREIHRTYDGEFPGSKLYVYRFGRNYLKLKIADDGSIVTAFPSPTDYF